MILLPNGAALPDPDGELRPAGRAPAVAVRGSLAAAVRQAAASGSALELRTAVEPRVAEAHNVAALLRGANPTLRDQIIVIGAHLDHLGRGGEGSLAPDEYGTIHNGADDNASGIAVLIETARRLATRPERPGPSVLFIGFSGEERGLLGSAHFVENPTVPRDDIIAMLNLDMVGRLRENSLAVMGVGTAEEWRDILARANGGLAEPLRLGLTDDGFGPSDHSSFYARGIPVLHFFTNSHEDYHRPSDDWQKLNVEGLERIADLVTEVTLNVATQTQLTAIVQAQDPHAGAAPTAPSSDQGYGPYLGTIPDFTPVDTGVRITGVREGSPAQQAGLQAGDVIVGFDGTEITDLYAYTYALRAHKPGDTVTIVVLRAAQRITLTAVLGQR
ncbi:MAG: M28 family peptidase [Gemmatimonadetes bacterium]|nr:M28 family peptidase [Gemmatimonadota bacterium]